MTTCRLVLVITSNLANFELVYVWLKPKEELNCSSCKAESGNIRYQIDRFYFAKSVQRFVTKSKLALASRIHYYRNLHAPTIELKLLGNLTPPRNRQNFDPALPSSGNTTAQSRKMCNCVTLERLIEVRTTATEDSNPALQLSGIFSCASSSRIVKFTHSLTHKQTHT